MKKLLILISVILILGCSSNPKYSSNSPKRTIKQKYVTKTKKSRARESVAKAKKLNLSVGDELHFVCSYYGKKFHGRTSSNGEVYDMYKLTAAHKSLPFDTKLKVTNEDNGKSVIVRITDRGPFVEGRDLDLSYAAAKKIGLIPYGVKKMKIEVMEVK